MHVTDLSALEPAPAPIRADLARVRLLIFDFDGVFTTNQVLVLQDGTEGVLCSRSDGLGIGLLRQHAPDLSLLVLSAEENPVVSARCNKLKIPCMQGRKDKPAALAQVLREHNLTRDQIAYVGNDVNDVPCMRLVGMPIAVRDAWESVLPHARAITTRPGGHGAVREVCEWMLEARGVGKPAPGAGH